MLRTWPALLSWGAGLTHLALGAAVMAAPSPGPRIAVAVGLVLLGASELVWGALVLRSGRLIWSRALAPAAMALALSATDCMVLRNFAVVALKSVRSFSSVGRKGVATV